MHQAPRPQAARIRTPGPSKGWVPNQHGAWAFTVVPWLLGLAWAIGAGSVELVHFLLFAFWMVGYFCFFAASQWLKSHFKPRYVRAVATYGAAAGALGIWVLVLRPGWWSWILVFAPLTGYALWSSYARRERELVSGFVTILAATLIPVVMGSQALWAPGGMPTLAVVSAICLGYFFGTVLYVKTIIRERGKVTYVVASVAWHMVCSALALAVPAPLPAVWVTAFFLAMALRAALVAALGPMRGRRVSAKAVGIWEFVSTLALIAILVPGLVA